MPAPIFERVAEKLGLSPDHSEKLVRAMIREIRKRADQGQGVRVPDLGSFVVENGRLTFEPEASLARSVNHRFEGLSEESVALPEVEPSSQTGEGPTTITRGFDMGAWDPLDTGGASSNSGESQSSGSAAGLDDGPDTDEFDAPPDTDEFQAPPDTDEFEAPDTGEFDAAEDENAAEQKQPAPPTGAAADDENAERSAWDVGSVRPVRDATDNTGTDDPEPDEDTLSPARLRGEDAEADIEEPEIDASADLEVSDHRQANPSSEDPYDETSFYAKAEKSSDDGFSPDETDQTSPAGDRAASSGRDESSEDNESNIWSSESVWDLSTVTSEDVEDDDDGFEFDEDDDLADSASATSAQPDEEDDEPEYVSYRPPDADEQAAENQPARSIFDFDEESTEEKKEAPKTTKLDATDIQNLDEERKQQATEENDSRSRSAATTVTVVVLLLLVLTGGWIILGQQGIIPSPSRTLGLSDGLTEPADPATTPESDNTSATPNGTSDDASSASPAAGRSTSEENASSNTSAPDSDAGAAASGNGSSESRSFDASAGGFTIAVASRESESEARALVQQFRRNLSDTNLRIDLVVGQSGGTTRYRVGVGQFTSRSEATQMRDQMQSRLPNGAWPVPID